MSSTLVRRGILVPHRARLHARALVVFRGTPGALSIVCERAGGGRAAAVPSSAMRTAADGELVVASIEGDLDATLAPGAYALLLCADPPGEATVRELDYVLLAALPSDS